MGRKALGKERFNIAILPAVMAGFDEVIPPGRTRSDVLEELMTGYTARRKREAEKTGGQVDTTAETTATAGGKTKRRRKA